jgi:hypothetical protein
MLPPRLVTREAIGMIWRVSVTRKEDARRSVKALALVIGAAAIAAAVSAQPAAAQVLGSGAVDAATGAGGIRMAAPGLQLHAVNPSMSLSAPATSPIEEQMQDDYATSLRSAQRQLLEQNPSGVTRPELSIGRQLDDFTGPR